MPARTNAFQTLVYFLQMNLADGSRVTESAILNDRVTGAGREVDVLISGSVGGHEVHICLECRDHRRRQSVGWIEEMQNKHSRLPTNALILVSSSGFTTEARRVAASYGIDLLVPGESDEQVASAVADRLSSLWFKQVGVTLGEVTLTFDTEGPEGVTKVLDDKLRLPDGTVIATVHEVAMTLINSIHSSDAVRDATGEERSFELLSDPLRRIEPATGERQALFVRASTNQGERLALVATMRVRGEIAIEVAEVPLTTGQLGGHRYAFGQTQIDEGELTLMATEAADGQQRFTVRHPRIAKPRVMNPPPAAANQVDS